MFSGASACSNVWMLPDRRPSPRTRWNAMKERRTRVEFIGSSTRWVDLLPTTVIAHRCFLKLGPIRHRYFVAEAHRYAGRRMTDIGGVRADRYGTPDIVGVEMPRPSHPCLPIPILHPREHLGVQQAVPV